MRDALRQSCVALSVATATGAVLGLTGLALISAREPRDALSADATTALTLLRLNAVVALWPVALLWLGWHRMPFARQLGDVLVRAQLLGNGLVAGNALGQHPELWRYLPHLPLEWLAIATPVAAWVSARRADASCERTELLVVVVACLGLLSVAAVVETYLVPIA
jgi:hypothetical protein